MSPNTFWAWTEEDPVHWPEACCEIAGPLGALEVCLVVPVGLVRDHAHEDDALWMRFWRALQTNVAASRRNVLFDRCQQLHRSVRGTDIELAIKEIRIDAFWGGGCTLWSFACRPSIQIPCRAEHLLHPQPKKESENTCTFASCIFDKNEPIGLTIWHTFSEWVETLIFEQKVHICFKKSHDILPTRASKFKWTSGLLYSIVARNRDLLVNRDGGLEGRLSKAFPHSIDMSLHNDVRFFTALSLGILLDKSCLYLCLLVPKSAMNFFMQSLNFQLCMRIPLVLCEALAFSMRRYFQFRVRFHFVLALVSQYGAFMHYSVWGSFRKAAVDISILLEVECQTTASLTSTGWSWMHLRSTDQPIALRFARVEWNWHCQGWFAKLPVQVNRVGAWLVCQLGLRPWMMTRMTASLFSTVNKLAGHKLFGIFTPNVVNHNTWHVLNELRMTLATWALRVSPSIRKWTRVQQTIPQLSCWYAFPSPTHVQKQYF